MTPRPRPRHLPAALVAALALGAAAPEPAQAQSGGPALERIPNLLRDLSQSEDALELPLDDGDEAGIGVQLGFSFPFFGQSFTQVTVTTNGYLTFGNVINPLEEPIPSTFPPNGVLAPFWDDLDLRPNPNARIVFERSGTAPRRVFCVQWHEVALKQDPGARLTFQALLFETGEVQFHYGTMRNGDGTSGAGRAAGTSATIGIEAPTGTRGVQAAYHEAVVGLPTSRAFAFLTAPALPKGRATGDLDGDGTVTVLDQARLAGLGSVRYPVASALELIAADVAPLASDAVTLWGDGRIDAADRDLLSYVIVGREQLGPYLSAPVPTSPAPSSVLTLTGSRFDPVAANNVVTFTAAGGGVVTATAASVDAARSELTVSVPAEARRGEVFVTVGNRLRTNARVLGVAGIPAILAITPPVGVIGAQVVIEALELPASAADVSVTIGGLPASVVSLVAATSTSPAKLTVSVPLALAAGHHPVVVTRTGAPASEPFTHPFGDVPSAEITSPELGDAVEAPFTVRGTANDASDLARYELRLAPLARAGEPEAYRVIHTGEASVVAGPLGELDPTLLMNGYYRLELVVTDALGLEARDTVDLVVRGGFKIGVYTLSFLDLEIPCSGIAIRVLREYDSRDKESHDFGYGWRLRLQTLDVEEDGSHNVVVNNPISTRLEYAFEPEAVDITNFRHRARYRTTDRAERSRLSFEPPPGVTTESFLVRDGVGNWFWESLGEPFDPTVYLLTQLDGTVLRIHDEQDLLSIRKPDGNTLTITPTGIVHSGGKSVTFTRDTLGRVTRIVDPRQNDLVYEYDGAGDLVRFVDADEFATRFTYLADHYLLEWLGPEGARVTRNEYDADGRLIATIDAAGNRLEFDHDIAGRREVTRDRLGNPTVTEYDDLGRVVAIVAADGTRESFVLDPRGFQLARTDRNGNTWRFEYDAAGNQTAQIDPEGNAIRYTYDAKGNVRTITDADQGVVRFVETIVSGRRVVTRTDQAGRTERREYDASGNLATLTNAIGEVTTFDHDEHGNLKRRIEPDGTTTLFTYDANNNRLTETEIVPVGGGEPAVRATTSFEYTASNQLARVTRPDGSFTAYAYNGRGRILAEEDSALHRTSYGYDELGRLVKRVQASGHVEERSYDANGCLVAIEDEDGTKSSTLDARGRVSAIAFADGSTLGIGYDGVGNVTTRTDARGNAWSLEYDKAGRLVREVDPTGAATSYSYGGKGQVLTRTDPDQHTTRYEYDATGLLLRTIHPDGTETVEERDALGRVTRRRDLSGREFTYVYGTYSSRDALEGPVGSAGFARDQRGNVVAYTDPNQRVTSYRYDPLTGQRVATVLPLGQERTVSYDENGHPLRTVGFDGAVLEQAHDAQGNVLFQQFADGTGERRRYDDRFRLTGVDDPRGTTDYAYDNVGRRIGRRDVDQTVVRWGYDASSNVTSTTARGLTWTYTHDARDQLASVTAPGTGTIAYGYTAGGALETIERPGGIRTDVTLDVMNRLTRLVHTGPAGVIAGYSYGYDAGGNRTYVQEDAGRRVDYGYDGLARLTEERTTIAGVTTRVVYAYDPASNRTGKTTERPDGTVETIVYVHDDNDRLLREDVSDTGPAGSYSVTYAYDGAGRTLSRTAPSGTTTYAYDPRGRLVEVVTTGLVGDHTVRYQYDPEDNLVAETRDGVETRYVVDTLRPFAQVLASYDAAGNVLATYAQGRTPLGRTDAGGAPVYFLEDGQLSVRTVVDASGQVVASYDYDAFGVPTRSQGAVTSDVRYAGERYEPTAGLYYLRSRFMDPRTGRFLTRDTFEGFEDDPSTLHKYVYALQNPVNRIDPPGTFAINIGVLFALDISSWLMSLDQINAELKAVSQIGRALLERALRSLEFVPTALDLVGGDYYTLLEGVFASPGSMSATPHGGVPLTRVEPAAPSLYGTKFVSRVGPEFSLVSSGPTSAGATTTPAQRLAEDERQFGRTTLPPPPPAATSTEQAAQAESPAANLVRDIVAWLMARPSYCKDVRVYQYQVNAQGQQVSWAVPTIQFTTQLTGVHYCVNVVSWTTKSNIWRLTGSDPRAIAVELDETARVEDFVFGLSTNFRRVGELDLMRRVFGKSSRTEIAPSRSLPAEPASGAAFEGHGVVASTGELVIQRTDLQVPGRGLAWEFTRTYRSGVIYEARTTFHLGHNWIHGYDERLSKTAGADIVMFDAFGRNSDVFTSDTGRIAELRRRPAGIFANVIVAAFGYSSWDGTAAGARSVAIGGTWVRDRTGLVRKYNDDGWLVEIVDPHGNTIKLLRDFNNVLREAVDTVGRRYVYTYTTFKLKTLTGTVLDKPLLTAVKDVHGDRTIVLEYSSTLDLVAVTSPGGRVERYTYSADATDPKLAHNLVTITAPNQVALNDGTPTLVNAYDVHDRVVSQSLGGPRQVKLRDAGGAERTETVASGGSFTFTYTFESTAARIDEAPLDVISHRTQVLDRRQQTRTYEFNVLGNVRVLTDEAAFKTISKYDEDQLLVSTTLPGGQTTYRGYDKRSPFSTSHGNMVFEAIFPSAAGDPIAPAIPIVTGYEYEPLFNQVTRVTETRGFVPVSDPPPAGVDAAQWLVRSADFDKYTTRSILDYQEGSGRMPSEIERFGLVQTEVDKRVARGLGDLNLDGALSPDWGGKVVRVIGLSVTLESDSPEAQRLGTTNQIANTRYHYNAFGQPTKVIDAEGNVTTNTYFTTTDASSDAIAGYLASTVADDDPIAGVARASATPPARVTTTYGYDVLGMPKHMTDGRGTRLLREFSKDGDLLREVRGLTSGGAPDPGYETTYQYDHNRNLVQVQVENRTAPSATPGRAFTVRYAYDLLNDRVQEAVELKEHEWLITTHRYDPGQLLKDTVLPRGNVVHLDYDPRGLLNLRTRGLGSDDQSSEGWIYNANRNVLRANWPDGENGVDYSYDRLGRLATTTWPTGVEERRWHDRTSQLERVVVTGPSGGSTMGPAVRLAETRFVRDERKRVTKQIRRVFGPGLPEQDQVHEVVYDRLDRVTVQSEPDTAQTRVEYDGLGRAVRTTDALNNRVELTYDPNGNVTRRLEVDKAAGLADAQFVTHLVYDRLNRLTRVTDNLGHTTRFEYDSRDLLVSRSDAAGALVPDPLGLHAGQINEAGNTVTFEYDAAGRRVRERHALDASNAHNPDGFADVRYGYDPNSNLAEVQDDNGNVTSFEYDTLDRRTHQRLADTRRWRWTYDREHNVVAVSDPNGTLVTNTYDALNRLERVAVAPGTGVVGTAVQEFRYDGLSRLVHASDDNGDAARVQVLEHGYDSVSRLLECFQNGAVVRTSYEIDDRPSRVEYPGGFVLDFDYDVRDRVRALKTGPDPLASFRWVGSGLRELERTIGDGTKRSVLNDDGLVDGYDGARRLTHLYGRTPDGSGFLDRAYTYSRTDLRLTETRGPNGEDDRTDRYTYDSIYRLTSAQFDQDTGDGSATRELASVSYTLDGVGNRRERVRVPRDGGGGALGAPVATSYEVNAVNQYTSVADSAAGTATRTHDANGNLTTDGQRIYRYDFLNRLAEVTVLRDGVAIVDSSGIATVSSGSDATVTRFDYHADGRRARKRTWASLQSQDPETEVRYVYDGPRVCEERNGANQTTATYVWGPSYVDDLVRFERTADHPLGPGTFHVHQGARFDVVAITQGGAVVERRLYDDYGQVEIRRAPGAPEVGLAYGFQGREHDFETGLLHFRARYYDPTTGRFLQRDPVWDPASLANAYTFVGSNPVTGLDPSGEILFVPVAIGLAKVAGVAIAAALIHAGIDFGVQYYTTAGFTAGDWDRESTAWAGAEGAVIGPLHLIGGPTAGSFGKILLSRIAQEVVGHAIAKGIAAGVTRGMAAMSDGGYEDDDEEELENCFLAGTLVETTNRGRVRVEEVREDDRIAPPPGHEGCTNPRCGYVDQTFRNWTDQVVTVTAVTRPRARERRSAAAGGGGESGEGAEPPSAGETQTIRCTPGHPFFVEGRGWVFAGDLRVGDVFDAEGERVEVAAIEVRAERAQTFNFEVACHHTYRVAGGEDQPAVLVHNLSASAPLRALARLVRHAQGGRLGRAFRNREAAGIIHTFARMRALGYTLADVPLHYRGNQGLDMLFYRVRTNGHVVWALAEAKASAHLGSLKTYTGGLRQASFDYNVSRLERYLLHGSSAPTRQFVQQVLLPEARAGRVRSYVGLARTSRLFQIPSGWPLSGGLPQLR